MHNQAVCFLNTVAWSLKCQCLKGSSESSLISSAVKTGELECRERGESLVRVNAAGTIVE